MPNTNVKRIKFGFAFVDHEIVCRWAKYWRCNYDHDKCWRKWKLAFMLFIATVVVFFLALRPWLLSKSPNSLWGKSHFCQRNVKAAKLRRIDSIKSGSCPPKNWRQVGFCLFGRSPGMFGVTILIWTSAVFKLWYLCFLLRNLESCVPVVIQ